MEIRIETSDPAAMRVLLPDVVRSGQFIALAPGVEARVLLIEMRRAAGSATIMTFVITAAGGLALNLVANAIWDWMKGLRSAPEALVIDRTEVEFEEGAVKRVVSERIERRRGM